MNNLCARSVTSDSSVTACTGARQAPLSMGLPRQEYWSGLPVFPPPRDLPDPGIELASLMSLVLALLSSFATWEACIIYNYILFLLLSSNSLPIDNGDHHLPPRSHHTSRSPYLGKASHDSCFHSTAQKTRLSMSFPPGIMLKSYFQGTEIDVVYLSD